LNFPIDQWEGSNITSFPVSVCEQVAYNWLIPLKDDKQLVLSGH